eukprot:m.121976 g.121976  ORF g.121976 m.121976 type:complete len:2507 (+) comp13714_c0_seq1:761-8281(+)
MVRGMTEPQQQEELAPSLVEWQPSGDAFYSRKLCTMHSPTTAIAFSSKGTLLASGDQSGVIHIQKTSKKDSDQQDLFGHQKAIRCLAFDPRRRYLVSGSDDATIVVWSITKFKKVTTIFDHKYPITSIAFSQDGAYITSTDRQTVKVWSVDAFDTQFSHAWDRGRIACAACLPISNHVLVLGDRIVVLDATGNVVFEQNSFFGLISHVSIQPQRHKVLKYFFACAGEEPHTYVQQWSPGKEDRTSRLKRIATLRGQEKVVSLAYSPAGDYLFSAYKNHSFVVWATNDYSPLLKCNSSQGSLTCAAWHPGTAQIALSDDASVQLWDIGETPSLGDPNLHEGEIHSLSMCSGPKLLMTASEERVQIWDAFSLEKVKTFDGFSTKLSAVTFTPDGSCVVAACGTTLEVWSVGRQTKPRYCVSAHEESITSIVFSPCGSYFLSASMDGGVRKWVWDGSLFTNAGHLTQDHNRTIHQKGVRCTAIRPDGKHIVTGGGDSCVRVWSATSLKERNFLSDHSDVVTTVAYSPDSEFLASASLDAKIYIWHTTTYQRTAALDSHENGVTALSFSSDSRRMASGSLDLSVIVWALPSFEPQFSIRTQRYSRSTIFNLDNTHIFSAYARSMQITKLPTHYFASTSPAGYITCLVFDKNGTTIATGGEDGIVRIWEREGLKSVGVLNDHQNHVSAVAFSPDGRTIVSGSHDKTIKVWDSTTHTLRKTLGEHVEAVLSVSYSPNGAFMCSSDDDGLILLWNTTSWTNAGFLTNPTQRTLRADRHLRGTTCVAFSPCSQLLVSGNQRALIHVWNVSSQRHLFTLRGHESPLTSVSFSANGSRVFSSANDQVKVWDVSSRQEVGTQSHHELQVNNVVASADSTRLLSNTLDAVHVWDTVGLVPISTLIESSITCASMSANAQFVASGHKDGRITIWDSGRVNVPCEFKHENPVNCVAFSPDGKIIVCDDGSSVKALNALATGEASQPSNEHLRQVTSVACSPCGTKFASTSMDNTLVEWSALGKLRGKWCEREVARGTVTLDTPRELSCIAMHPNCKEIVTAEKNSAVCSVWSVASRQQLCSQTVQGDSISAVVFSPDGSRLAIVSDAEVSVHDTQREYSCIGSTSELWCQHSPEIVVFSQRSARLLLLGGSRSSCEEILVVSSEAAFGSVHQSGKYEVPQAHASFSCAAFSPSSERIVLGDVQGSIGVRTARSLKLRRAYGAHQGSVTSIAVTPDGKYIVSGSIHGSIKVQPWNFRSTNMSINLQQRHRSAVLSLAFHKDGAMASGGADKVVRVWKRREQVTAVGFDYLHSMSEKHTEGVSSVYFTENGDLVSTSQADTSIKVWDPLSRKKLIQEGYFYWLRCVSYGPQGTRLATSGRDHEVWIWDAQLKGPVLQLRGHDRAVTCLAFHPSDDVLASGSDDCTIKVWDLDKKGKKELRTLPGHSSTVTAVAFHPSNDSVLFSGSLDRSINVWDISTGSVLFTHSTNARVSSISLDSKGRTLAAATDNTISVWSIGCDQEDGRILLSKVAALKQHSGLVNAVAFSPNDASIASCSSDNSVQIWPWSTTQFIPLAYDDPKWFDSANILSSARTRELKAMHVSNLLEQVGPKGSTLLQSEAVYEILPSLYQSMTSLEASTSRLPNDNFALYHQLRENTEMAHGWIKRQLDATTPTCFFYDLGRVLDAFCVCKYPNVATVFQDFCSLLLKSKYFENQSHELSAFEVDIPQKLAVCLKKPALRPGVMYLLSELKFAPSSQVEESVALRNWALVTTHKAPFTTEESVWENVASENSSKAQPTDCVVCPFPNFASDPTLLNVVVEQRLTDLFDTLLLKSWLTFNWDRAVRIFSIKFGFYMLLTLALTAFSVASTGVGSSPLLPLDASIKTWRLIFLVLFTFVLVLETVDEARQIYRTPRKVYVQDGWNWLDVTQIVLGFVIVTLASSNASQALAPVLAISLYLRWFGTLFYLQAFQHTGTIVRMFLQILVDMAWFLMILGLGIVATATSLQAIAVSSADLEPSTGTTSSLFSAMFLSFNMVILNNSYELDDTLMGSHVWLKYIIFIVSMVVIPIVMLNLLIALMNDSFERIQDKSTVELSMLRARIIREVLTFSPSPDTRYLHVMLPKGTNSGNQAGAEYQGVLHEMKRAVDVAQRKMSAEFDLKLKDAIQTLQQHFDDQLKTGIFRSERATHTNVPTQPTPQLRKVVQPVLASKAFAKLKSKLVPPHSPAPQSSVAPVSADVVPDPGCYDIYGTVDDDCDYSATPLPAKMALADTMTSYNEVFIQPGADDYDDTNLYEISVAPNADEYATDTVYETIDEVLAPLARASISDHDYEELKDVRAKVRKAAERAVVGESQDSQLLKLGDDPYQSLDVPEETLGGPSSPSSGREGKGVEGPVPEDHPRKEPTAPLVVETVTMEPLDSTATQQSDPLAETPSPSPSPSVSRTASSVSLFDRSMSSRPRPFATQMALPAPKEPQTSQADNGSDDDGDELTPRSLASVKAMFEPAPDAVATQGDPDLDFDEDP